MTFKSKATEQAVTLSSAVGLSLLFSIIFSVLVWPLFEILKIEENFENFLFVFSEEVIKISIFLLLGRHAIKTAIGFGIAELLMKILILQNISDDQSALSGLLITIPGFIMHIITGLILHYFAKRFHFLWAFPPMVFIHYVFNLFIVQF